MATYDSLRGERAPFGHLVPPPDLARVAEQVGAEYVRVPLVQRVLPRLVGSMLVGRPERRLGPAIWGLPGFIVGAPLEVVCPPAMSADRWRELARRRAVVPVRGYAFTANPFKATTFTSPCTIWLAAVYAVVLEPAPRTAHFALVLDERGDPVPLLEAHFDEWLLRGNLPRGSRPRGDMR